MTQSLRSDINTLAADYFAALMREQGFKPEFIWLPLSILNAREFFDHHFLFHVFLIPFTLFS
ncbi:MAG TPA: hypothetical protein PKA04_01250, partial [Marmoricola sp.]|nr:hypothetical protein [Marmoricola sp.]